MIKNVKIYGLISRFSTSPPSALCTRYASGMHEHAQDVPKECRTQMKHVSNHPCFPLWPLIFNLGGQLGYSIYSLTVYLRCTYTDGHCKATRGGVAYGVRCSQSGGNTAHPSFHSHRPPTHLPPACSATYRLPNTHS